MTPYKELLMDMRPSNKQIRAAGNSVLSVEAEGNIIIELKSKMFSTNATVENVMYIPKLRKSLLSIACINDHGFDVTFKRNRHVWIQNEFGHIIAEGHREGNLFYMDMRVHKEDIVTEYTFKVDAETLSTYMLWYLRMGHLGIQNLQKMSKMVTGLENIHFTNIISGVCEGCMFRKQCRLPFRKSDTVRDLMELVHSDLLGLIRVPSITESRYVLTFIEEKSHFPKCYFLKTKEGNVVLEKFKEYKVWAKNITGKRIKILRTDGGGEYVNNAMSKYLEEYGIEHQRTVPYTPQQNGVSERFNKTAMEKIRAILYGGNLPLRL